MGIQFKNAQGVTTDRIIMTAVEGQEKFFETTVRSVYKELHADIEPHPTSAVETATDNKTREQTRITFLFIFINLFSICLLYLFCYKNQAFYVIFVTFM